MFVTELIKEFTTNVFKEEYTSEAEVLLSTKISSPLQLNTTYPPFLLFLIYQ